LHDEAFDPTLRRGLGEARAAAESGTNSSGTEGGVSISARWLLR
jgi:hypothetical protein